MNIKFCYFVALIAFSIQACAPVGNTSIKASILPDPCLVRAGGQIALTLNGQIPANTEIHWEASMGRVVWADQGLTATYIAADTAGDAVITVSFISGTPAPFSATLTCSVTVEAPPSPPNVPMGMAPPTGAAKPTVVISEVMGNPCGDIESRHFNQYVELYNYGDEPIDVGNWWLYDEGEAGTPDQIVAWSTRSTTWMDAPIVPNSTVLPPRGFAVVLSPIYTQSYLDDRMPYKFPNGTLILTIAQSETLGDNYFGIISNENGLDTVTLYIGGETVMEQIVDTYGTPLIKDQYPIHVDDDRRDHAPLYLHECESAERVNPLLPDSEANWAVVKDGSPGEGPY
jgi:hypothetical protein